MKQLLFISLMLVATVKGQEPYGFWYDTTATITIDTERIQRDEFIMMEIVSIKKPGLHFFKKGYKRGDKYWYFDGRRVKPLPKNWMVWEYREIKD
jgi:hypothetical protein